MGGPDPESNSLGACWSHSPPQVAVRLARHLAAQSNLLRPVHGEHQDQAGPGQAAYHVSFGEASSCVRQLQAHPLLVPAAPPPSKGCDAVQANAGCCLHLATKRGGIPCVASGPCRDPCSHFTSHHRCGPPIGSPLGPGRLIRLSGWPAGRYCQFGAARAEEPCCVP